MVAIVSPNSTSEKQNQATSRVLIILFTNHSGISAGVIKAAWDAAGELALHDEKKMGLSKQ